MSNEHTLTTSQELGLDSLEIQNFRLFEHLVIERLGRVNLIVGKNNVGKTSLLEALWIYADRGYSNLLNQIINTRHENFRIPLVSANGTSDTIKTEPAIRHLYTNSPTIVPGKKFIAKIGTVTDQKKNLELSLGWYRRDTDPQKDYQLYREDVEYVSSVQPTLNLIIIVDGQRDDYAYEYDFQKDLLLPSFYMMPSIPHVFVSSGGFNLLSTASGWDHVVITDLENEVLSALQIIEPEIERLNFISSYHNGSSTNGGERIPFVRLRNRDGWVPLRSLGEGINRILGIVVALVNARNGFLLVDEIENGLHYSVQADLWRLILRVAKRLNVQVFTTTHNWDCVEAFQQAVSEIEGPDGMLIRLQKRNEEIVPTLFDESRLSIAVREDIEIR